MRPYALALFVAVTVSTAAAAEEQKPEKKAEEEDPLLLDMDVMVPAKPATPNPLDLGLDGEESPPAAPPPPAPADQPLPPPPVPEPAPVPVETVKRPPDPPPPEEAPKPLPPPPVAVVEADPMPAPKSWLFSVGVVTQWGGMSAETTTGLGVSDRGSINYGVAVTAEWDRWEGRSSLRQVHQDRWLSANIRSSWGVEGSLHFGRWLLSPAKGLSLGVFGGGSYRSHWAPLGAWWQNRGPTPNELRAELAPSAVWRFAQRTELVLSVPLGYGFGSVDQREWRKYTGPLASVELVFRIVLG